MEVSRSSAMPRSKTSRYGESTLGGPLLKLGPSHYNLLLVSLRTSAASGIPGAELTTADHEGLLPTTVHRVGTPRASVVGVLVYLTDRVIRTHAHFI